VEEKVEIHTYQMPDETLSVAVLGLIADPFPSEEAALAWAQIQVEEHKEIEGKVYIIIRGKI